MNLDSSLARLETSDLVRRLGQEEPTYSFKHALVQDTALESLLKNERKRLHRLVAETLETVYAENLDDYAARLFQHYDAAGVTDKAMLYAERAGDAAMRLSAYREAIVSYQRALEIAPEHPAFTDTRIRLMTQLGRAHELANDYDTAIALYQHMREFAQARGEHALELAAMTQLAKVWAVAAVRYEPEKAQAIATEALELARTLDDRHTQARVLWTMMLLNLYGAGGASAGVAYGQESLALARALNWREQMAYTLNDLFYTYSNLGEMERARACALEAGELWRELDNKPMLSDNLNARGMDFFLTGEFASAFETVRASRALSQSIGNHWGECTSFMIEGYAQRERGDFDQAITALATCIEIGDPIGVRGPVLMAHYELAKLYALLGDSARGLDFARDALERTRSYTLGWDAWAYATLAETEIARGAWDAAERAIREIPDAPPEYFFGRMLPSGVVSIVLLQAEMEIRRGDGGAAATRVTQLLTHLERGGLRIFLPAALEKRARIFMHQHAWENAARALDDAHAIAEKLAMEPVRLQIALAQWDLANARGNADAAQRASLNAQHAWNALCAHVPAELRESLSSAALTRRVNDHA